MYIWDRCSCTLRRVNVSVSDLRAHLGDWLDLVQAGEDVLVTERGRPVVRIVRVEAASMLEQLHRSGQLARPTSPSRPTATGAKRVRAKAPVADLVAEQRR
jgi:prevent-host-death family protein